MLVNVNATAHRSIMAITRTEYDLLRDKANLFNQVCEIQRKKIAGGFNYDWDYVHAMENLLNELIVNDTPTAMETAKEGADE